MPAERQPARPWWCRGILPATLLSAVVALGFVVRAAVWYPPLLIAVSLVAFRPTLIEAWVGLRRRKINIEAFNSLAVIASLALGEWFSAAFIVLMLTAARILGEVTRGRSRRALTALVAMRPTRIFVERDGVVLEMPPGDLAHEDTVLVREGETVPVDGEVLAGEAVVSEAPVTGESRPVLKFAGATVLSPSLVVRGTLKVRARRIGADTTLERIIRLVGEAQAARTPVLRLADRFAGWFLPATVLAAAAAWLVTGNKEAAIAVAVVVCADDVAVSIPLAYLAAVGAAARRGIIISGSEALERLGRVTTVFFDKTGTLTYGRPRVEAVSLAPGVTEKDFWRVAGSLEKFSKHPFSQAVLDEVASRRLVPPDPESFETLPGRGARGRVDGADVVAGPRAFLVESGVADLPPSAMEDGAWYFARDGKFIGRVIISDLPRAEAKQALLELKSIGVRRQAMLTGDSPETASRVADALGITEVHARLLPDEKLAVLAEAKRREEVVAMVGDGINDAPSLAAADVGIAMGEGGTAVAVETAPVVIMNDDLRRLAEAIMISRGTRRVVIGDFVIWAVTNVIGLVLVFSGFLTPAAAAFYNFATDFLPLANSARIFGWGRKSRF